MSSVAGPSVFFSIHSPSVLSVSVSPPRRSSGTAGETLPHRDRTTGSEDQGLSKWVLLRSVYTGTTTEDRTPSLDWLIVIPIVLCFRLLSVPFLGSLSALVYQHSITPISLPCALRIPEKGWISVLSFGCVWLYSSKQSLFFVFFFFDDGWLVFQTWSGNFRR